VHCDAARRYPPDRVEETAMKQLLNYALRIRRSANTSYDATLVPTLILIAIGIIIAIYAITVNPNDAATLIEFFP
jgi:hypothetical protein